MDERMQEERLPIKILRAEGSIENAGILLTPAEPQIGLDETHLMCVNGRGYIILDFKEELNGSVRILTQVADGGGCRVRIRTGESISECCAEEGDRMAGNYHTLRDAEVLLVMYSDMRFFETGFRFVRIDFLEEKTVYIKSVMATSFSRKLQPKGSFRCSDERVNEIFRVASRTLMLNMHDYLWDGIKRDRLVWVGDMHPETTAIACLFGDDPSIGRSLTYSREHTPLPNWMNRTPTYTAWWLIILHDYYMQNGRLSFLREQRAYVDGALRQLNGVVREDGTISRDGSYLFDWPSHGSDDETAGIYALWVLAAKKSRSLFKTLGLDVRVCDDMLEKLSRFRRLSVREMKQCEAFLVYAGVKGAENACSFLTRGGAKGFSTFMSYYILHSIAAAGRADTAVELMKQYYGGMLDMGATSFWEDFDLDLMENSCPVDRLPREGERDIHGDFGKHCYVGFRHSLCHGWSCGPIAFLMKSLSGLEISEAGCRKIRLHPQSGGLDWYEISYPTPFGNLEINWKNGTKNIRVPDGIELTD